MLYIFDNTEKLISTLPKGSFFNAIHREVLNGENTFQFSISADSEYNEHVVEGNLVAFRDLDSYWQVFEIKRLVDVHGDGLTRTAYCEHVFYELLDDIVTDKRPSADATAALAGMLENTRWQVGIVDDLGAASTSAYYISALEAVQKVAEAWQGELNWRCVINGGVITRYVDLRAMVGTDTGKQFAYSKDILSIEREVDTSEVITALYGRGKGVETESGAYGRRLTFADVEAPGKPLGQEWIGDNDALARWGRPGGRHRFDVFIDEEETDPVKLLEKTRDELDRRKVPRVTYRLDVVSLEELTGYEHEKVRLGDLVRVIDREFRPELVVSARVIEIERDILDPANTKVVLGSFAPTIVEATINTAKRLNEMANRPFNTKWLDGKINVLQNAIENTQSYVFQTGEDGILILDAPTYDQATKAMKLGGGIFAIANQKDGNGGWNWRTFGTGSGFTADEITAGKIRADLVEIGPQTTFAPGYDPSQKASMGVDADCTGLWHFDGTLNSHKGVSATFTRSSVAYTSNGTQVAANVPRFEPGKFAQAWLGEEGTTNLIPNGNGEQGDSWWLIADANRFHWNSELLAFENNPSAPIYSFLTKSPNIPVTPGQTYTYSLYMKGNAWRMSVRFFDSNNTQLSEQRLNLYPFDNQQDDYFRRFSVTATAPANASYAVLYFNTYHRYNLLRYIQFEAKPYATSYINGTRSPETLTIPTAGVLNPQEGTVACWFYYNPCGKWQRIISFVPSISTYAVNGHYDLQLDINPEGYVRFRPYREVNGDAVDIMSSLPIEEGWHFVCCSWSEEGINLFVDDQSPVTSSYSGGIAALDTTFTLGAEHKRPGDACLNSPIDELRIDKIARTDEEIAGWYKANAPFYSSEDMKQWPGYMRLETDGLKVYDAADDLRVLVGSWLKDAVRKYGIKIIDGEIYSSFISTGPEDDDRGAVKIKHNSYPQYPDFNWGSIEFYGGSGTKLIELGIDAQQPSLRFFDETAVNPDVAAGVLYLGTATSTKELSLLAYNRGLSLSTTNEYIRMGSTGGVTQEGIRISGISSDLYPYTDGGANIGMSNRRWWAGFIRYMVTGDLAFTEQTCAICGERFGDGDLLALLTKTILEDGYTYTIPVHEKCKDIEKTIEVKVPEMTTKYQVNDQGEVVPYKTALFEEVEEEILRVHPDYELDENTGKFKRKLNDWNRQFYSEDELLNGVYSSERVAKARDTVIRKKPKFRTLSIQVGKPSK